MIKLTWLSTETGDKSWLGEKMKELCLVLPWPPSVNHYKKVGAIVKTRNGKLYQQRVNTNETKTFYFEVYIIFKQLMATEWAKEAYSDEIEYEIGVTLHPPDEKRRDVDNSLKVLIDSLVRAKVIKDDSQITKITIERKEIKTHGQTLVKIIAKPIALDEK